MSTHIVSDAEGMVRELRDRGLRLVDVAKATGTTERTVSNWGRGRPAAGPNEDRLRELSYLAGQLAETLDRQGPGQWLRSPNRLLDGRRPLDVLGGGGYDRVLNAVHAYLEGTYV